MDDNEQYLWLMERNHEDYLTWIVAWLASLIAIVTILVGIISAPTALSRYLDLVGFLYFALVWGMIFSVSRLVDDAKRNLCWALKLNPLCCNIIRDRAKARGGFAWLFVHVARAKNENKDVETAKIHRNSLILVYIFHLALFGALLASILGESYWIWIFLTAVIILVFQLALPCGIYRLRIYYNNKKSIQKEG